MTKKREIHLVYDGLNDHKPVQKGDTYCSPACGLGCKLSQYRKAVRGAAALQKKLKGDWDCRVFEKLGWKFDASAGPLTVVGDYHGEHGTVRYACYLKGHLVVNASYATPQEAVDKVLHHISSSASKGLTILELAFKAAGQEEKFLGWLRHACPALARRCLGDQSLDQDGGWNDPETPDHRIVACEGFSVTEVSDIVSRLSPPKFRASPNRPKRIS